jgi:hypothetical protein
MIHQKTSKKFALKRILMHNEKDGVSGLGFAICFIRTLTKISTLVRSPSPLLEKLKS